MGKKSAHQNRGKLSIHKRNELRVLCDAILVKSREKPADPSAEFENYNEIYNLLEHVISIEHEIKHHVKPPRNESMIQEFIDWCKEEGAKFPKVEVKRIDEYDLGLVMIFSLIYLD